MSRGAFFRLEAKPVECIEVKFKGQAHLFFVKSRWNGMVELYHQSLGTLIVEDAIQVDGFSKVFADIFSDLFGEKYKLIDLMVYKASGEIARVIQEAEKKNAG